MRALILTDVQYDFLPGGALAVSDGDTVIPVLNQIQDRFDLVVATQDWHPEDHGSFASNHPGRSPFEIGELAGMEQVLWPNHCVQGEKGAGFSDELDMKRVEAIFRKGVEKNIDSYSGFFDNGRLKATGLAAYLKGRGVKEVFIGGLAADYCVGFTALDALGQGFDTTVIEDATKAIDAQGWQRMKERIREMGGKIVHSSGL
jgi:nicotinamidase/pyrazinamidase